MMNMNQKDKSTISIVIPVYNEQDIINELYKRLYAVLSGLRSISYKIIFVDDGSTDQSWEHIKKLCDTDVKICGIKLSRNFGHQFALSAGIDYTQGEAVIMMDADLQHPPEFIPELIRKWKEGYDIVYTIRKDDKERDWFKKITSRFFYTILNKLSKANIPEAAADFRLLSNRAVTQLRNIKERVRFLRGLINWLGYRKIGIPYVVEARLHGRPKYSLLRMIRLAITGIASFSSAPLYISAAIGLVIAGISFLYGVYAIYVKLFTNRVIPGWSSILVSMLFLGGIQLIAIGILGGYLAKVYEEIKQRPLYIVEETKGLENK